MKILISSDGMHAHYFQRAAWLKGFTEGGIQTLLWDCKNTPAFDVFDTFEPDVFLGQSYNLDSALLKCIYERPHLKMGLRAGDWGDFEHDPRFNVLHISENEKRILEKLKKETGKPDFVHIHYAQDAVDQTHSSYKNIGIDAKSIIMCADVHEYSGASYDNSLACDIGFVGGYWPHKGIIIDKYLTPMCHPVGKYNIKIFGNQPWHVNQYCGFIKDNKVKDLFKSAKVCPNLSEPHAHEYGFDINERCFKILCAGGFCVTDNVTAIRKIFDGNGVVFAESPEDFVNKIEYYIDNTEERISLASLGQDFVLSNHTNFHRTSEILNLFGLQVDATRILNKWDSIRNTANV